MPRSIERFENRAAKSYLVAYNGAQFVGWLFVIFKLVENFLETLHFQTAYAAVGGVVRKLQLIACLEVLHAGLGLVRSGPLTAFMQWAGRTHVLIAIMGAVPEVQTSFSVFLTFAAWSFTEIIRYPQYGLSGLGVCPKWLTWLRYTMFIVLYPAGVYGEMLTMYSALPLIREHHLYHGFFSKLPFRYDAFVIGLLLVYPVLFLVLYRHMFRQRWAKLGKTRPATSGRSTSGPPTSGPPTSGPPTSGPPTSGRNTSGRANSGRRAVTTPS